MGLISPLRAYKALECPIRPFKAFPGACERVSLDSRALSSLVFSKEPYKALEGLMRPLRVYKALKRRNVRRTGDG